MSDLSDFIDLMKDGGASEAEVLELLRVDPSAPGRVGPQLEVYRAQRAERQAKRDAAAYARTPQGKRERAAADFEAAQERDAEVEKASRVLQTRGMSEEDVAALTPDEVLHSSGFQWIPEVASQEEKDTATLALAPKWGEMNLDERLAASKDLGFDIGTFEEFVGESGHKFEPTFGGGESEGGSEGGSE